MIRNFKKTKIVLLSLFCTSAFAEGPGWTQVSKVEEIVVVSSGGVNIRLSPSLQACTSQSGYGPTFASIYPDHPGINRMQSNLLAAMMAGKKVMLYFTNSDCKVWEMRILN